MEALSSYDELKRRSRDLEIFTNLIQAAHMSSNLEIAYAIVLDSIIELKDADMEVVYLGMKKNMGRCASTWKPSENGVAGASSG